LRRVKSRLHEALDEKTDTQSFLHPKVSRCRGMTQGHSRPGCPANRH
jgi:hypothetical protein